MFCLQCSIQTSSVAWIVTDCMGSVEQTVA